MEPSVILAIAAVCLGAIVGSFLNALLYRYRTGFSVLRGRSRCMRCGHTLRALDLVPIVSYLFLRGRCRYCGSRVSVQYPLVEAVGAMLGFMVYQAHPEPLWFLYWLSVWMVLLFIVVYDLRHQIIPWSASGMVFALAVGGVLAGSPQPDPFVGGLLLALPLFLLSAVSRGGWMGWGDAPLQFSLGVLLGLLPGLSGLVLAFWIGAAVGIFLLLLQKFAPTVLGLWGMKGVTIRSEVPFAPFLVLGAWCVHFFHVNFFSALTLLF